MKKLKDYSKPFMVAEKFTPDEYVAVCAGPAQYLYADAIKPGGIFGFTTGEDGVFQDSRHFAAWLEVVLAILSIFTGNRYTTDGEYLGIRTTDSPSKKGKVPDYQTYYPVYGSETQLSDGNSYSGPKLNDYLRVVEGTNEYYIQGNIS